MSEYAGPFNRCRVRICATRGWLAEYNGQTCDAIFYAPGVNPQIDTERLHPPLPKWQSVHREELEVIEP